MWINGFVPWSYAGDGIFCRTDDSVNRRYSRCSNCVDIRDFSTLSITFGVIHILSGIIAAYDYYAGNLLLFCEESSEWNREK